MPRSCSNIRDGDWVLSVNAISFSLNKDEKLWNMPSEREFVLISIYTEEVDNPK